MKSKVTIKTLGLITGYTGKKYKSIVMQPLDASLRSGELTCLLGPNGAGKSTLLKTLSGFIPPLGGEIIIEGKPLHSYSRQELATTLGVVLTERTAPENMTVRSMIELGRSPYTGFWGRLDDHDKSVVDEAIRLTGISNLTEKMMDSLSDGERQKVMIAKALAQETPVIFLDEPTAFLDYPSKVETMRLLHLLSRKKEKTIFMSTHDLDLALQIADRIWLIDKQAGVTIGTPEDLALNGSLAKYFEGRGVIFDSVTGLFRLQEDMRGKIAIRGEGTGRYMAEKALARNGIEAVEYSCNTDGPVIEVIEDGFKVGENNCRTIEELLSLLSDLL